MSGDKIFYKRGFTIPGASQFESERAEFGLESEVGEEETLAAAMHRVRVFVHGEIDLLRSRLAVETRAAKDEPQRPAQAQKPPQRRWAADDEAVDGDAMFVGRDDQWRALERLIQETGRNLTPKWRQGIMRWHSGKKSMAAVERAVRETIAKMEREDVGRAH
jgi:hypothetical protein